MNKIIMPINKVSYVDYLLKKGGLNIKRHILIKKNAKN